MGPVGDVVLGQHHREGAERVGLDDIRAHLEERAVEVGDDVGPGVDEDLVAPLERRPSEVVGRQVARLQVGASGAVVHDDPLARGLEIGVHAAPRLLASIP